MDRDPLIEGLAGLAAEPPPRLLDRIAARWTHADSAVGEVFVAFTDQGVAYVRRDGPGWPTRSASGSAARCWPRSGPRTGCSPRCAPGTPPAWRWT
ncbi:hypothetical protein ACFQXA_28820 [Nocardiopsis composta]